MKLHENPSSGTRVFPCGQTDNRADMTKLIVAFRNFANVLKNNAFIYCSCLLYIDILFCDFSVLRKPLSEPEIPRRSVERKALDLLSDLQPLR